METLRSLQRVSREISGSWFHARPGMDLLNNVEPARPAFQLFWTRAASSLEAVAIGIGMRGVLCRGSLLVFFLAPAVGVFVSNQSSLTL